MTHISPTREMFKSTLGIFKADEKETNICKEFTSQFLNHNESIVRITSTFESTKNVSKVVV
jgi:hypothetical protein